jgi:hypothetical protein
MRISRPAIASTLLGPPACGSLERRVAALSGRTLCRWSALAPPLGQQGRSGARWAPTTLYFNQTLFNHRGFTETELQGQTGYSPPASTDYVSPENRRAAQFAREDFRGLTMADVERQAAQMPWGTAAEVTERIIEAADIAGAGNVQISLDRGVSPQEMFMEQIRRFAREVLPAFAGLQSHAFSDRRRDFT